MSALIRVLEERGWLAGWGAEW